jgi:ABC-type lipoprotein release transport system permease subunit
MPRTWIPLIAWRNLWRNTRRTLLTLSAIAFGTFLAVMYTALQDRSYADMIDLAARLGGGHVAIQHPEYLQTPTLTRTVNGTDAIRALALSDPRVSKAVDRITGEAMLTTASRSAGAMFVAFDPALEDDHTLSFLGGAVEGDPLSQTSPKSALLGRKLAEHLHVSLGEKVVYTLIDRSGPIVSGMARVGGLVSTGAPSVDGGLMLLPIATVRTVLGYGPNEATEVAVFLHDGRSSGAVARSLAAALPPGPVALTWNQVMPDLSGFIAMKVGGARFMELIILVLVSASIFNTLFVSVMERMREFGIMMAIGWERGQIFALVMWESLWLALVGLVAAAVVTAGPYFYLHAHGVDISGALGKDTLEIAGVGIAPILHVGIFPQNAALIVSFAIAATLLSGLYPAWRAGRVVPVETIKLV